MGVLASIVRCHDMAAESSRHTILFVHNSNDLYGADVVLLNLIRGLDRKQFRAIVALPADVRHINRLSAKLEALKIPFYFLPLLLRQSCIRWGNACWHNVHRAEYCCY